jgi:3'(2'), 5'-bisphosphate nucleotidase
MSYTRERDVAVEAVVKASRLCRVVQANLVSDASMSKKDRSPVTVADFGAQAVVTYELRSVFPDTPMVGEEDAAELRDSANAALCGKVVANVREIEAGLERDEILDLIDFGTHQGGATGRHFTLDPIDGTKGFLRLDQYAIALALIEEGEVVLGVLGCPNLPVDASKPEGKKGCLFIAERGQGASVRTLDDPSEQKVSVTQIDDPSHASFCESVEKEHSSQSDSAKVAELLGITAPPFRIDSQCKYAAVSRGDASVYLRLPTRADYEEKIWDHAAGAIVVTEAGGRVTDVNGNDLDFSLGRTLKKNKGVIVSNGRLHDRVVAAVKDVLKL